MSHYDDAVTDARNFLEADGFVVLRAKSYHDAQRRLAVAKAEAQWCRDEMARQQGWIERDVVPELTRLRERIGFLYRSAIAFGATPDDLAQELK